MLSASIAVLCLINSSCDMSSSDGDMAGGEFIHLLQNSVNVCNKSLSQSLAEILSDNYLKYGDVFGIGRTALCKLG
jgi:hypothetical protein